MKFKNFSLFINEQLCCEFNTKFKQNANDNFTCDKINKNADSNPASMAILRLLTPLRIKKNNVFVRDENLALNDILKSIFQRQNALFELDCQMGQLHLSELNAQSYALLRLGELIGAGKSCVFGLDKIAILC